MDATTQSNTTNVKAFNPVIHMEPLAFAQEGLLAFALHDQAPPLAWTQQDNDRFEAMMLEPPTDPEMKKEPLHLALRISLPANGEAGRAEDAMPSPKTPSTICGVTSGEDNDEDDALELKKRERRRLQVREASSRRRLKLKAEGEFLDKRMKQLEAHTALLRKRFPHAMRPPPPRL